jgi:hypothetical protein
MDDWYFIRDIMDELIVTIDELKELFRENILRDTPKGWFYKDTEIDIIAIHQKETKHIRDVTKAETYKLKRKERVYL